MFVNNFIYFYIGVCFLLIVFEIIWGQYIRIYNKNFRKRKIKYQKQIIAFERGKERNLEIIKLTKELKNINNFMAFQTAYEEVSKRRDCRKYIYKILSVFMYLNLYYSKKKNYMEKAYFAYVISKDLNINNVENINALVETLYVFLNDNHTNCRVNAMNALCVIGNVNNIKRAVKIITETGKSFNSILLSDCLKNFRGNKFILLEELFENFDNYNENVQIAIVMFMQDYNFIDDGLILKKLDSNNISVNVKCEILRYFQTNLSGVAKNYLLRKLNSNNLKANDFTIKAIGTLGYYDDVEVENFFENLKNTDDKLILETVYRSMDKINNKEVCLQI